MVSFDDENAIMPKDDYFDLLKENIKLRHYEDNSSRMFSALRICVYAGGVSVAFVLLKYTAISSIWDALRCYAIIITLGLICAVPLFLISYAVSCVFEHVDNIRTKNMLYIAIIFLLPLVILIIIFCRGGAT